MTTETAQTGFTAFFARKSDMQRAWKYLRNCSILSQCAPHHGDNRLHILIPITMTGTKLADQLTKAGHTFTHDLPR